MTVSECKLISKVDHFFEMHDKPQTFLTVVDKMIVHSLVRYGVAICVRSVEFTTAGDVYLVLTFSNQQN